MYRFADPDSTFNVDLLVKIEKKDFRLFHHFSLWQQCCGHIFYRFILIVSKQCMWDRGSGFMFFQIRIRKEVSGPDRIRLRIPVLYCQVYVPALSPKTVTFSLSPPKLPILSCTHLPNIFILYYLENWFSLVVGGGGAKMFLYHMGKWFRKRLIKENC